VNVDKEQFLETILFSFY